MAANRLRDIPGFSIDRVAASAGDDPRVLRLENLDTDLRPPAAAVEATRQALDASASNSYLPFTGRKDLRSLVANRINRDAGTRFDDTNVVITCGGTEAMMDALLAITDPGDEVLLSDPTYAGMIYRATLAGCVTHLVPFLAEDGEEGKRWGLDVTALRAAISPRTRVIFLMNPSMPSGAVLSLVEWQAVADLCCEHDLVLLYNAAMEQILYDGHPFIHPAGLEGMAERTVTIGSLSKEYRMIGWRIGWAAGPRPLLDDIGRVHIYNVVTPTGIAQAGAIAALAAVDDGLTVALAEWRRRRDEVLRQLDGYGMIAAAGGWSQLMDVGALGFDSFEASHRLMAQGRVAATPMRHWGEINGDRFVRLVFSNETVERLSTLGSRVLRALGPPRT